MRVSTPREGNRPLARGNLRMVANIRDVLAHHPGSRLLVIVGASHKGYFDAYLNQMHDVRLADASLVLR